MGITALDSAVIGAYLGIITVIGLAAGYKVRKSGDYFLGGRKFGTAVFLAR